MLHLMCFTSVSPTTLCPQLVSYFNPVSIVSEGVRTQVESVEERVLENDVCQWQETKVVPDQRSAIHME